jgi:hypothetical protein
LQVDGGKAHQHRPLTVVNGFLPDRRRAGTQGQQGAEQQQRSENRLLTIYSPPTHRFKLG